MIFLNNIDIQYFVSWPLQCSLCETSFFENLRITLPPLQTRTIAANLFEEESLDSLGQPTGE